MKSLVAAVLLVLAACGGGQPATTPPLTATIAPTEDATPTAGALATGKIAFLSDRDGNQEVYVMNADGSNQTRLTNNPGDDSAPAWSPDGTKIAFVSASSGNGDIFVMNADGFGLTNLTNIPAVDSAPDWSPAP